MIKDCDPADLHLKLLRLQYLDFRRDPGSAAVRLLQILQSDSFTGEAAEEDEPDEEKTVILDTSETILRLRSVAGPQQGSQLVVRTSGDCILGRAKDADVRILDDCVSRRHAKISTVSRKGRIFH